MNELSFRDRELVALGAALAANCIPCIEHHVPKAREAGLTEDEIAAALALADQIRQVPARKVLEVARAANGTQPTAVGPSLMNECTTNMHAMAAAAKCC